MSTKELPILFSEPMQLANLHGHKKETRRTAGLHGIPSDAALIASFYENGHFYALFEWEDAGQKITKRAKCPYGQPGDYLWVREPWRVGAFNGTHIAVDYKADNFSRRQWLKIDRNIIDRLNKQSLNDIQTAFAKKTPGLEFDGQYYSWPVGKSPCRWRRSFHMPQSLSRMKLLEKELRIERLQDITELGAHYEGVITDDDGPNCFFTVINFWYDYLADKFCLKTARESYRTLFEKLNGAHAWDQNPWVWVIKYEISHNETAVH